MNRDRRLQKRLVNKARKQNKYKTIHTTDKNDGLTERVRQNFINMLERNIDVVSQARHFTAEDKIFCLEIYRRSRSFYKYLSYHLPCPSITALNKQLQNIPLDTGCNEIMVKYLKLAAKEIDPKDLNIILIWDEMFVQPAIHYDRRKDKIVGFEDWGTRRTRKFVDHAIIFYIRCLASGNHMPLGYGFCKNATRTGQLVTCIKQWLTVLINCGFKLRATVCDQGGTNMAAINMLIKETNDMRCKQHKNPKNTFIFKEQEIIPLYDYMHLQRDLRNNLLTKDLVNNKYENESERQFASWNDIVVAYEMDKYSFLSHRRMPQLVDRHIFPKLIPKMKIEYATQVLNQTVANFIDIVVTCSKGILNTSQGEMYLPSSAEMTADIIFFFDKLLDSFHKKRDKELSSIISRSSNHISFWQNAVKRICKMDFVESTTHKYIRHNSKCLKNWIWTIKGAQYLWNKLQTCGFSSFNLRFLNQDLVENCFSQIRDHRNNNPTSYQFCASFKMLVATSLTSKHSISANCEENNEGLSLSLLEMIFTAENYESEENNESEDEETKCAESSIPPVTKHNIFDTEEIIRNISTNEIVMKCAECVQGLKNENILKSIEHALKIAEAQFVELCYAVNVKRKLMNILYLEVFSKVLTHCPVQRFYLTEETARQFINQWCEFINKILNGKQENCENNYMYNEAKKMYIKQKNVKKIK